MIPELLDELVDYIKRDIRQNHYDTGALYESMEADFNYMTGNISYNYKDYMEYLDNGTYFESVINSTGAQRIIKEIYEAWVEIIIDEKLNLR